MDTHRITVGLAAFGALVLVYVGYTHFHRTPQTVERDYAPPADRFPQEPNELVSKGIEDTKLKVYQPRIKLYNDKGQLVREMGFSDMAETEDENLIEVVTPFLDIYDPDFICHVTAAKGSVRFDPTSGDPFPKDATFSGEVTITFEPTPGSRFQPSTVRLDHIVFLSDQSLFSSSGPIHFESPQVELKGTGLQCVYNDRERRIEYFWLKDLDILRLLVPEEKLFFGRDKLLLEKGDLAMAQSQDANDAPEYSFESAMALHYYSCQVRGNTLVESPQQVIFAEETINLTKFFWPKPLLRESLSSSTPDANQPGEPNGVSDPASLVTIDPASLVEIKITCDRGIMVAPDDVNTAIVDPCGIADLKPRRDWRASVDEHSGQSFFQVRDLEHALVERDTLARGPIALSFYTDKGMDALDTMGQVMPVQISAQDMARYEAEAKYILFSGQSQCTLEREEPNTVEHYTLIAPRITVELYDEKEMQAIAAHTDLKHMRADGGAVKLRMTVQAETADVAEDLDGKTITGVEMTCRECDYSPIPKQELFEALGPGQILLNNANPITDPNQTLKVGDRPYYAGLQNFDTLRYHIAENRIVADGNVQDMQFDYFPVVDGRVDMDQRIQGEARHVEIELVKTEAGKLELGTITALGNVSYRDKKHNLYASGLSYDHTAQWMTMWSETDEPCYINGVPTTSIRFNLKTGEVLDAAITEPGSIPVRP